jgi:hypothetical protein
VVAWFAISGFVEVMLHLQDHGLYQVADQAATKPQPWFSPRGCPG